MDWKAKKHITEQLDIHCQRSLPKPPTPAQAKKDIKRHRQVVVNLVENQIGNCNCKFSKLVKNREQCNQSRRSTQIGYILLLVFLSITAIYAALIYGAIVGASYCSKDEYGCQETFCAKVGIPGLQFKKAKQSGII